MCYYSEFNSPGALRVCLPSQVQKVEEAMGCLSWQKLSCWGERSVGRSLPFFLEMWGDLPGLGKVWGQGSAESRDRSCKELKGLGWEHVL